MKHRGLFLMMGALALGLAPARSAAQERVGRLVIGRDGEPDMNVSRRAAPSAFRLFANRDGAYSNLRSVGYFRNTCLDNYSGLFLFGCYEFYRVLPNGYDNLAFGEGQWTWGVGKGEWQRHLAAVPSLQYVLGGGYTALSLDENPGDDTGPLDNTLGIYHAGAQSTGDGSCLDHGNSFGSGNPLLAGFGCTATYGSLGWTGARPIPLEVWKAKFDAGPSAFTWSIHSVTDAELDAAGVPPAANKAVGAFQSYGFMTDANADILAGGSGLLTYGKVIPGGTGNPTRTGWPLGIDVRTDAFTFQIPALKEISFYQSIFVNNSQRVYGVGLDYDSLYLSLSHSFYSNITQQSINYDQPQWGAIVGVEGNDKPCDPAIRNVSDIRCDRWQGRVAFQQGTAALIMLRSPIGDLRNKLFTRKTDGTPCTPGDPAAPFCDPTHPLRGDTLTYNHHHQCGFRACARNSVATDPAIPDHEQRIFGMLSSTDNNVLGSRAATGLTDQVFWHTFRSYDFPSRTPDAATGHYFKAWVPPGNWDYNHDGVRDTMFLDFCDHRAGCAALWGDTMPNGRLGGYSNVFGTMSVGPISLAAGDTVEFLVAVTSAVDSASIMAQVAAAQDAYFNFFLGPEAAPASHVVATEATPAVSGSTTSLFWDERAERYTDPFLKKQYSDLVAALGGASPELTALGRLGLLNPWLDDTLSWVSTHNLARLHVFKSCDGGGTWTNAANCAGAAALGGTFKELGWQPYRTYSSDDPNGIPNSLTDAAVSPGRTYLYNIIGETRGAQFQVQNGDSIALVGGSWICVRSCRVEALNLAPVILNALSPSTGDPFVARVYVPVSVQAGASRSLAVVTDSAGPMTSRRLTITVASDSVPAADYRVRFAQNGRAVMVTYLRGSTVDSVRTLVTLLDGATAVASLAGRNLGGFTVSGGTTISSTTGTTARITRDSTVFSTTVMALSRIGASAEEPLLVSSTLTAGATTPGAFFGNADYPGFTVDINAGLYANPGFDRQYYLSAGVEVIGPMVEPGPTWQSTGSLVSTRTASTNPVPAGEYSIEWVDRAFGPGEPFTLDLVNRTATAQTIQQSLAGRSVGLTGDITAAVATKIGTALGRPAITTDSLVAVKVPFRVTNLSYRSAGSPRPVTVAMVKRTDNTIVIGNQADTMRVTVGADEWVPGDQLIFLEPDLAGALQVTWTRASIACNPTFFTRFSCNPVRLQTTGASIWVGTEAGMQLRVSYHVPVTSASQLTIRATPPNRGANLVSTDPAAIRAGLAAVRVVPNPYIAISGFGDNLMFTHMPPRGLIRIYTVAGQFVQQITWTESDLGPTGDLVFTPRTREGNEMGPGLYVFVLHAQDAAGADIGTRTDKFVIIR